MPILISTYKLFNHIWNKKNKKRKRKRKKDKNNPPIKKGRKTKFYKNKNESNNIDLNGKSSSISQFKSIKVGLFSSKKNNRKSKLLKKSNLNKNISKIKINFDKQNYLNDYEINNLTYKDALQIDKRTYFQYYLSLLKIGNLFLFSFVPNNDYNSMILKICIFFFSFGIYYTVNALFFTDSTMGKIYKENGEYDFIYQLPKMIYSNLICTVINIIIKYLSLSENNILKIKTKKENINLEAAEVKKCLLIKFVFFYLVSFIFLIISWFYASCFCAVYKNTQLYLIKDVIISFILSLVYPFGFYLAPGILRISSLNNKDKDKEFLYNMSLLLQKL